MLKRKRAIKEKSEWRKAEKERGGKERKDEGLPQSALLLVRELGEWKNNASISQRQPCAPGVSLQHPSTGHSLLTVPCLYPQ